MTLVVDASVAFEALTDSGELGRRIRSLFVGEVLCAPAVFPFEVAATIRRHFLRGDISELLANEAHANLRDLRIAEIPYALLAHRAWELRENVTVTDGTYIALAELLDGLFVTMDARLTRAPGIRCRTFIP